MSLPLLLARPGRRAASTATLAVLTLLAAACTGAGSGKLGAPDSGETEVEDAASEDGSDASVADEPGASARDASDIAPVDGEVESLSDGSAGDAAAEGDASDITVGELEGHWSNPSWGDMVLRRVGDEVWGTYSYDQGTVVGTYENGLFVGWWTEVPSRLPSADAGEVEFRFARNPDGSIYFDGHWRYGTTGDWKEDWDLTFDETAADEVLLTRFDDPTAFAAHP